MKRFLWFLFGFIFAIVLLIGLPVGIAYYGYTQIAIKDIQAIAGQEFLFKGGEEDTAGVLNMTLKELVEDATATYNDGADCSIKGLSKRYGFSSYLPEKFDTLWAIDLKGVITSPDGPVNALMDSVTVQDIITMTGYTPSGILANVVDTLSDWTIKSVTGGITTLPIGTLLGVGPAPSSFEGDILAHYTGFDNTASEEGKTALLRKLLYSLDTEEGTYIGYIKGSDSEYKTVFIEYSVLDTSVNTTRYKLVDDKYVVVEDTSAEDLLVKVAGEYKTVDDVNALYTLYADADKYVAYGVTTVVSNLPNVLQTLTVGDVTSLLGSGEGGEPTEEPGLLDSLKDMPIMELVSSPDALLQKITLVSLLGANPENPMMISLLYAEADATTLEGMADTDELWYYDGDTEKYVSTTKADAPTGVDLYTANTVASLTEGDFLGDMLNSLEVATLMGDVSDNMMKMLLFKEITPEVGDKAWYDDAGTMKQKTVTQADIDGNVQFYKGLTLTEMSSISVDDIAVADIIGDISDPMLNAMLYSEIDDNGTLSDGDVVFYKSAGSFIKVNYSSTYESYRLYEAVKVADMGTAISENIQNVDLKDILNVTPSDNNLMKTLTFKDVTGSTLTVGDTYWYENGSIYSSFVYTDASSIPSGATKIYSAVKVGEMSTVMGGLLITDVLGTPTTAKVYEDEGDDKEYYTGIWAALATGDGSTHYAIPEIQANQVDTVISTKISGNGLTFGLLERMQGDNFLSEKPQYRDMAVSTIITFLPVLP